MKRILVTGCAGFIGSHLCRFFLEKGSAVIGVDNLITGNINNLVAFKSHPHFTFMKHDVTKFIKIKGELHYVLHFASPASPIDYLELPIQTLKVGALGTHNALGLARNKKAKFFLASTSEVYGDPRIHPQPETYWGNVNCVGPRGCYDEAKRFSEAITLAYHRTHKIDIKIARIFNSILADQPVIVFNDDRLHLEEIEKYSDGLGAKVENRRILVPAFNPQTFKVELREANALIKHIYHGDAYELVLGYGRKVKITGDHSVFKRDGDGNPIAIPVRNLKIGDYVAIPGSLPVVEKDIEDINIAQEIIGKYPENEWWNYAVHSPELRPLINERKRDIYKILHESQRYTAKRFNNNIFCVFNKFRRVSFLPLYVLHNLKLSIPEDAKIRIFIGGAHVYTPNKIKITNEILWLIGFFIAEGCAQYQKGKSYSVNFSSDEYLLKKAVSILEKEFGVHTIYRSPEKSKRCPSVFVHSKILYLVFDKILEIIKMGSGDVEMPSWTLQLPLSKLKYILEGYREGDGTHSGEKIGKELSFDTKSKKLALQLTMLLLRFGIVASVGKYMSRFREKYGDRKFPFYRVTVCELSTFNILEWDKGVKQKLLASRKEDLVWAWIKKIKKCKPSLYVYDFSVPGAENFIAGNGVFCHNTYGPMMRRDDGRAIPNFINQALKGQPITIFGDGSQTRSFCYISDLIEGIYQLMKSSLNEPVNLGNPNEITILELTNIIKTLTLSKSKVIFKPLPLDDPRVRQPDITRARKNLGWEPKISLEEGLKKTIEWFKS